jgi:hypothetical protein
MKKIFIPAALLICAIIPVFSSSQENWFGGGFTFGNAFEFDSSYRGYLGSPGFYISAYGFPNDRNYGFFLHGNWVFPVITRGNDPKYDMELSGIFGVCGRYSLTNKFTFYGGIGLDSHFIRGDYYNRDATSETDFLIIIHGLGIGGDMGFKYDITDVLYVNLGCTVAYLFYNKTNFRSHEDINGKTEYIRKDSYNQAENTPLRAVFGVCFIKENVRIRL